ncbi:Kelch domain-containing protein 7A [Myotis davidii]|uniref:Kelch domain-containing protein 7A n=1 Tax=Myotis davidii TaxID=225400 RepID=L5LR05_MYODS|nr:Kelch domain-containing protein 7A [Myotis davidii]
MLPEGGGGAEAQDWHLDMQLTGKVVLSAATLLLLTAAYRLYKSRPARAPLWGRSTKAKAEEETEGSGQPEAQGAAPGAPHRGLRCRSGNKGPGVPLGGSWENPGGSQVLGTPSSNLEARETWKPERKGAGEDGGGRCLESGLAPPRCSGQDAGTAAGGKPELPHCPPLGSEPKSSPAVLAAVDGGSVGGGPAPWQDGGLPEQPGAGEQASPLQPWMAHWEGKTDMSQSWVFTHVLGACREEVGALQAASNMGLALHQQEGATNASYTFSSVARVRVEASLLQEKVAGMRPRLQGKVYEYYVESTSQATSRDQTAPSSSPISEEPLESSTAGSSGDPHLELVAGTNFFHLPLTPGSTPDVRLDLGNCYEVLTLAKRQNLEALKEAAYKVMSDNYLQVLRSPDIYGRLSGAERELCAVVGSHVYCVGRRRTLLFLADNISPRFVPKELRSFPSPQGTLLPTVLTLPSLQVPQTRV